MARGDDGRWSVGRAVASAWRRWFQAPSVASPGVERLIQQAERDALQLAGVVRAGVVLVLLLTLMLIKPAELPAGFGPMIGTVLGLYLLLAGSSILAARKGWYSARMVPLFALVDMAIFAAMVTGYTVLGTLPIVAAAASPAFLFLFLLLALAALRYSPATALVITGSALALGFGLLLAQNLGLLGGADTLPPLPISPVFLPQANTIRLLLVAGTGLILAFVVARGRRLLIDALTLTERHNNLSRYLPKAIAARVEAEGIEAVTRGRQQPAAVLFADIVGFTRLAETMAPEAVGQLLGQVRVIQRDAVESRGGVVDKFIGDAVMGVFGVPEPGPDDAAQALEAGQAMLERLAEWNQLRRWSGETAVALGVGIHWGQVFVGAIGDAERLEFATLGDTVNVAQRVEAATRQLDADLLVTHALLVAAGADLQAWERVARQPLRGRAEAVDLYRPLA